jgi:hypothetical protein
VGLRIGHSLLNPVGGTKAAASKGVVWLALVVTLLSGCGRQLNRCSSEESEAFAARQRALIGLCTRDRQAMLPSEIVDVLRFGGDLYMDYHGHSVQIVQLSKIEAVPIGDHWIVGARVQATDLVTIGHDWQAAMWLVENVSAPSPQVWSQGVGAELFPRAPRHDYHPLGWDSSWYEASLSAQRIRSRSR